jgi:phosphopantothenoylcysteine decarboxylase/phosphopantothenate--cysteine ligase
VPEAAGEAKKKEGGMRLLVSAGPTREHLDPVRYVSNRSSGKMGFAIAEAGVARGHEVRLVAGPVGLATPAGVARCDVVTAAEMLEAMKRETPWSEAVVMAAAVADWRPAVVSGQKLKKRGGVARLEMVPTADILLELRALKGARVFVGFAAETEQLEAEAGRKLREKGLDAIAANDVGRVDRGFESDFNAVTFLTAGGGREEWPLAPKREIAERLVAWLEGAVKG